MRRLSLIALALSLVLVACGDDGPEPLASSDCKPAEAEAEDPCFYRGRVILEGEEGSVLLEVEIAETPQQQGRGLMHRESLGEDEGMVFLFFQESTGGFWMKNTLIPLSIAFFDAEGTIVDILDMEPCRADPCESYVPSAPYHGALEVNQGMFGEWNIDIGDHVEVVQGDRDRLFG